MTARYLQAHWEQVADVYREALEDEDDVGKGGPRPTLAIAETWSVPVTTAARWVKVARSRGLLPPTKPGGRVVPGRARCRGRCPVCCPKPES